MILSQPLYSHRPSLHPLISTYMLTSPTNNSRKPKPHSLRTPGPTTNIYYLNNFPPNLSYYSLQCNRINNILHHIRSHTNPHTNSNYPMRFPNRTSECRYLLLILHLSRVPPPPSRPPRTRENYRNPLPINTSIY